MSTFSFSGTFQSAQLLCVFSSWQGLTFHRDIFHISSLPSSLLLHYCAFFCGSAVQLFRQNSHRIFHKTSLSCHVFYFGECTEMLPLQKIFHTQCRGRYLFGSKVQRSNIKSRQFLNLSLSTVQFEEPLSKKRAIQPQRLLLNPLQWIKKEPLRLKGASEVHHSRQNHPLKKVAP